MIFYIPIADDNLGGSKKIPLSQGKFALVDNDDFEKVSCFKWSYTHGYARRIEKIDGIKKLVYLHRFIIAPKDDYVTDHINGDKLDNRKQNLRVCLQSENLMNRKLRGNSKSGFKGVYWNKEKKKWHSQVSFMGQRISGKYFSKKEDAAKDYNTNALKLCPEFSKLNVI